jgi:hypothetical protein
MTTTIETQVQLGRPVNPNSVRQIRLNELKVKRELGLIKRGRPAVEGSTNSYKKAVREEKLSNGIELRRGRPVTVGSESQIKRLRQQEKIANGVELRRGRPVNTESKHYQKMTDLETRRINGTLKLGRPKVNDVTVKVKHVKAVV